MARAKRKSRTSRKAPAKSRSRRVDVRELAYQAAEKSGAHTYRGAKAWVKAKGTKRMKESFTNDESFRSSLKEASSGMGSWLMKHTNPFVHKWVEDHAGAAIMEKVSKGNSYPILYRGMYYEGVPTSYVAQITKPKGKPVVTFYWEGKATHGGDGFSSLDEALEFIQEDAMEQRDEDY